MVPQNFSKGSPHSRKSNQGMSKRGFTLEILKDEEINNAVIKECCHLFNTQYAIWNDVAASKSCGILKGGERVKATAQFLRATYLNGYPIIARIRINDETIGHAIATIVPSVPAISTLPDNIDVKPQLTGPVMWITQLVVHREYRSRGHATTLLRNLIISVTPTIVGISSSHPHALLALKRASMSTFDLDFIRDKTGAVLSLVNVPYLNFAPLTGILFQARSEGFALINMQFNIELAEPIAALENLPVDITWPLGTLVPGHEFIAIFEVGSARTPQFGKQLALR